MQRTQNYYPQHYQPMTSNYQPATSNYQPVVSLYAPQGYAPQGYAPQGYVQPAAYPSPAAPGPSPFAGKREVTFTELYQGLNQTRADIKKIRGWHGARLAGGSGVTGGLMIAGGVGVTVATGGTLAPVGAALVGGGVALAVGGAAAGTAKTQHGRNACQSNPALMQKIVIITEMKATMKPHKAGFSPAQKKLYKDLRTLKRKVDGGSLKEAAKMTGRATAGVVGGAAGAVVLAAAVGVAAAAGEGGGDMFCCWGGSPTFAAPGGGSNQLSGRGGPARAGVYLDDHQLARLITPIAPVVP